MKKKLIKTITAYSLSAMAIAAGLAACGKSSSGVNPAFDSAQVMDTDEALTQAETDQAAKASADPLATEVAGANTLTAGSSKPAAKGKTPSKASKKPSTAAKSKAPARKSPPLAGKHTPWTPSYQPNQNSGASAGGQSTSNFLDCGDKTLVLHPRNSSISVVCLNGDDARSLYKVMAVRAEPSKWGENETWLKSNVRNGHGVSCYESVRKKTRATEYVCSIIFDYETGGIMETYPEIQEDFSVPDATGSKFGRDRSANGNIELLFNSKMGKVHVIGSDARALFESLQGNEYPATGRIEDKLSIVRKVGQNIRCFKEEPLMTPGSYEYACEVQFNYRTGAPIPTDGL